MNNLYFTSDLHLGHQKSILYCNRPFTTADEMDEELIQRWNDKVLPNSTVYVLGDLAFHRSKDEIVDILRRLKGNIVYIVGNHDKKPVLDALDQLGIKVYQLKDIVVQDPEMEHGQQCITLCHYPMISWNKSHYGAWQLYGHHHGSKNGFENKLTYAQLDVSVEAHDYTPISYEEVKTLITKQYLGK
jgi:calcineurin-like phosphoesterase family protein